MLYSAASELLANALLNFCFLWLITLLILYSLERFTYLGNTVSCYINRGKFMLLKLDIL